MHCIEGQMKTFLKLSIMVPIFSSIGTLMSDILVPFLQNNLLKKNIKLKFEPFLLKLLIALLWPAFLCVFFNYSGAFEKTF